MSDISSSFNLKVKTVEKRLLSTEWNTVFFNRAYRIVPMARIFMPTDGEGEVLHGDTVYKLEKGMSLLIPPFTNVNVSCRSRLEKYWMSFNIFMGNSQHDVFSSCEHCLKLEVTDIDYMEHLFKTMIRNFNKGGIVAQFEFNAAAGLLIAPFFHQLDTLPGEKHLPAFIKLMSYIDSHLKEKLTLEDLARNSSLSPAYLSHLFKKNTGMRLFEYINSCRMNYAQWYLSQDCYSISEVAEIVGIADQSQFSKIFRKTFGISPTDFKKITAAGK